MVTTETLTQTAWTIDPAHSEIGFKVKHLMVSTVRGRFREYEASIESTDDEMRITGIDFRMNAASIDTGNEQRDAHLRSADFFDAENFKDIRFTSRSYEKTGGEGKYALYGDLTMKGVTKPVRLEVEFSGVMKDPWGNEKAVFSINGKINRKDWGLNWNAALETGGVLVSDDVWINADVQLSKDS